MCIITTDNFLFCSLIEKNKKKFANSQNLTTFAIPKQKNYLKSNYIENNTKLAILLHNLKIVSIFAAPSDRERTKVWFARESLVDWFHRAYLCIWLVIEVWCNGSTRDSGPLSGGSSPSTSTKKMMAR